MRFTISHTHIYLSFANMERFLADIVLASATISLFHSSLNILLVVLLPKLVRVIVTSRVKLVLFTYTYRTRSPFVFIRINAAIILFLFVGVAVVVVVATVYYYSLLSLCLAFILAAHGFRSHNLRVHASKRRLSYSLDFNRFTFVAILLLFGRFYASTVISLKHYRINNFDAQILAHH